MKEIFHRVSVRKFEDRAVESDKVEQILRAAMAAPSAGNQQPWEFIVVENKETLAQMANVSPYATPLKNAAVSIIVLVNKDSLRFPSYWQQDLAAATQNLLLEAAELGLGAVWLGIAPEDTTEIMEKMVDKLLRLRIFSDENDKINLSLSDVGGSLLLVSQFTLYADCRKGNRPSFVHAAPPAQAEALYEACKAYCRERVSVVESGIFGADMQVELCNDGPFTVLLDSAEIIKN